jgi:hypothetical protein
MKHVEAIAMNQRKKVLPGPRPCGTRRRDSSSDSKRHWRRASELPGLKELKGKMNCQVGSQKTFYAGYALQFLCAVAPDGEM